MMNLRLSLHQAFWWLIAILISDQVSEDLKILELGNKKEEEFERPLIKQQFIYSQAP